MILGGSFGAGNYALCGKAFDPRFIFAWPTARYAVMGGEQAASTLLDMTVKSLERQGHAATPQELAELRDKVQGQLRPADGRPLRRGPRLGRRDHRSGRKRGGIDLCVGSRHAACRGRAVPSRRLPGVSGEQAHVSAAREAFVGMCDRSSTTIDASIRHESMAARAKESPTANDVSHHQGPRPDGHDHPQPARAAKCPRRGALVELSQALDDLHLERRVRAVILTGAGPAFCAGMDLTEMLATAE